MSAIIFHQVALASQQFTPADHHLHGNSC